MTMLRSGCDRSQAVAGVTLATLKPGDDTMLMLLARVAPRPVAAA